MADEIGPDVVVVLNYHGRDDTLRCVSSIVTGSPAAIVVVVDNGSDDRVLDEIASRWPAVGTLQTGSNLGFTGGMNAGITWALSHDAQTVTVLNNDTIVPPGAIDVLTDRVRGVAVAVSPEVRYLSTGSVWFGAGVVDHETALPRHLAKDEILAQYPHDGARAVDTLAGCCITASATTWRHVGGFDERFFLLFEDADWSQRAQSRGVRLVVDPAVRIDHAVSASFTGADARLGLYYYTRNGLLFGKRWQATDAGRGRAVRFLRRHAARPVVGSWRRGDQLDAVRGIIVLTVAVAHHLTRRYGRAPSWLQYLLVSDLTAGRPNGRFGRRRRSERLT